MRKAQHNPDCVGGAAPAGAALLAPGQLRGARA